MVRKLGDVAIALLILGFVVATFSSLVSLGDDSEGVSSGSLGSGMSGLSGNLSSSEQFESDFSSNVDESADVEADPNQQLETRGDGAGGIMNVFTKNLFVKFFSAVKVEFPQAVPVISLIVSLIGVTITILILRFWRGDGKI